MTARGSVSLLGVNQKTHAHNKTLFSNHRPASGASYEWPLLADQKLHKSRSFCYELQPWHQVREEMLAELAHQCQIINLHSPTQLKIKGKHNASQTQIGSRKKKIRSALVLLRFFTLSTVNIGMQKFVFPALIIEFSRIYCPSSKVENKHKTQVVYSLFSLYKKMINYSDNYINNLIYMCNQKSGCIT